MNKSLVQLYEELQESEDMAKEAIGLIESQDKEKMADWLKAQGCDATLNEARAFFIEKSNELEESGELTPEQLEMAAGGTVGETVVATVCIATIGFAAFC